MPDNAENHYFGIYRGTVLNNIDPQQKGRLMVQIPDVTSLLPSSWAMPCVPFAGIQSGVYVLPAMGAGVWVQFEQGNPDFPIWMGGWWGSASEVPSMAMAGLPTSPNIVLQTAGQNMLMISDMPGPTGGIMIKTTSGAMISISDINITISNGKGAMIVMTGPTVDINSGALTVI